MRIAFLPPTWADSTAPSDLLWRFIGLDKLAALLERRSLHFSRTDQFEDPLEGLVPRRWHETFYGSMGAQIPPTVHSHYQTTFASCWYRGIEEPAHLWRLNPNIASGVGIVSTQARLVHSLGQAVPPDPKITEILFGGIRYIDHKNDSPPIPAIPGNVESHSAHFWSHYLKRRAFLHEQEVRATVHYMKFDSAPHPLQPRGLDFVIDTQTLIQSIVISPYVMPDMVGAVRKLIAAYGLNVEVRQSELLNR